MRNTLLTAIVACLTAMQSTAGGELMRLQKRLQGIWKVVELDVGGQTQKEQGDAYMIFSGNRFTIKRTDNGEITGTYTLDAAKSPIEIDLLVSKSSVGFFDGKTVLGIIKLDGKRLHFAIFDPGAKQRPSQFKTDTKKSLTYAVLELQE